MKALEKINTYNASKALFSTWLYQIARNTVIDHYRSVKTDDSLEDAWDVATNTNIERDTDMARNLEKVREYLKLLPQEQRDVVIMRVWDGLSHKEIAAVLNISEANSKMTFSRALAKINKDVTIALILLLALRPPV